MRPCTVLSGLFLLFSTIQSLPLMANLATEPTVLETAVDSGLDSPTLNLPPQHGPPAQAPDTTDDVPSTHPKAASLGSYKNNPVVKLLNTGTNIRRAEALHQEVAALGKRQPDDFVMPDTVVTEYSTGSKTTGTEVSQAEVAQAATTSSSFDSSSDEFDSSVKFKTTGFFYGGVAKSHAAKALSSRGSSFVRALGKRQSDFVKPDTVVTDFTNGPVQSSAGPSSCAKKVDDPLCNTLDPNAEPKKEIGWAMAGYGPGNGAVRVSQLGSGR